MPPAQYTTLNHNTIELILSQSKYYYTFYLPPSTYDNNCLFSNFHWHERVLFNIVAGKGVTVYLLFLLVPLAGD